ncbi:uncharacterized protein LOC110281502 [Arachis duranensis]|uniref:Uncharacterized protein LOC110281502 n=1 Tax=Arachis duranensis TaxID=130453 RepID=A0A6P5NX68_ARADU|nr:uncharacterized protein LOC110281502 [Arachis duranensis]
MVLTEECSAIIQYKLPQKLKDPRSFQICCITGEITAEKALCDLGASINLMSLAMMRKMRIEEAKPTRMALQLADRSFKFLHGIVEDLLVKVGDFIFPADFVVLDLKEGAKTSIVLGKPFLATARAIIDVQKDSVDAVVQETLEEEEIEGLTEEEESASSEEVATAETHVQCTLERKDERKEAPKLELKALPPTLKYTYLGENESYPLMLVHKALWFADIANFKAAGDLPPIINKHQRRKLINDAKYFIWDEPYLFKKCSDGILRRCISEEEGREVLWSCHSSSFGGHFGGERTAAKVL